MVLALAITITAEGISILAPTLTLLAGSALVATERAIRDRNVDSFEEVLRKRAEIIAKEESPAKAPGKPTEKDGFIEPKGSGGLKAPPGGGNKKGWQDKKGNTWYPTGPGSGDGTKQPHGGPHWDVVDPRGNHWNVYPDGRIRK
ncbi:hypothetical protein TWF718_003156 [Orbilia javanica]|uniref:Toxin 37-like C-terminal domain-containing protein n=1 Tax=Orbilia javanica TaxID=47235 RepID=A0AAN8RBU8_9PEZI